MTLEKLWDEIGDDLGWNDCSMSRARPYTGQPHTCTGIRGSAKIEGITFRDLRDAYIRAYCLSAGGADESNMPYYNEAQKGEKAALCEADIFNLKGDVDPIAVVQNLGCELEKLMGTYPNVPKLEQKS
jgi:hypothetical protein